MTGDPLCEWERMVQPLTALVARAEVVDDAIHAGEYADLSTQLAAMRSAAERLLARLGEVERAFRHDGAAEPTSASC